MKDNATACLIREVVRSMESLPEELYWPLVLRDVRGMSYQEIAEMRSLSFETVQEQICEARKRVAVAISPILGDCPEEMGSLAFREGN